MSARGFGRVLATAVAAATFAAVGLTAGVVMPAAAAGNNNPHAGNDKLYVAPGSAASIDVLRNDRSLDGFAAVTIEDPPASHGVASMSAAHVLTYIPAAGYRGPDSVAYSVTDNDGDRNDATVSITVGDNVDAVDDSVTGEAGQPLTIDVTANDSVSDGVSAVSIDSTPGDGHVSIAGNSIVYTSDSAFRGHDSFSYRVDDRDGDHDIASVDIAVYKGHIVTAASDIQDVQVDAVGVNIPVTSNDLAPDGFAQVQIDIDPANGSALVDGLGIVYRPSPGYQGNDTFSYTVIDNDGDSASSFVDIRVIVDAPVNALDDSKETTGPTTVHVTGNDGLGDQPTTVSVTDDGGPGGQLSMVGNDIHYEPASGFLGKVLIPYQLEDVNGDVAFGSLNVLVYAGDNPVHAVDDEVTAPVTTSPIDVLANDDVGDGLDALQITTDPSNGDAWVDDDGQLFYTADPGATSDYLEYCVFDVDGDRDCGRVHVMIPGNAPSSGPPPIVPPPPPAKTPLTVSASLSKSSAPLKSLVTMSGKVSTGAATVTMQRKKGSAWVNVSAMAVRANGAYTFKLPTSASGRTTYSVKATDTNLTTTRSAAKTLSVFSASITKVHAAGAEYVVLKNTGKTSISLRGMKLKDKHRKSLTLPAFTLLAGKSVTVWTGKGKVTKKQLHVGKKINVWSKHDVAKLVDSAGTPVAQKKY